MATLATIFPFFRKPETTAGARERSAIRVEARVSPYALRSLPNEDVFFYSKRVDNSRVVREADPRANKENWGAIAVAVGVVSVLTTLLAPTLAGTMAGYRLQALRQENRQLLNERRALELEEARRLSPAHLQELARQRQMTSPAPGQIVRLDSKDEAGSVAKAY